MPNLTFPIYITSVLDEDTGLTKMTGVYPEFVIPFVLGSLYLKYDFVQSDVLTFGEPKVNGTWPGDLGILQRKEADISVGVHNIELEKFVDFHPFESIQRVSVVILASSGKQQLFDFFTFLYQIHDLIWHLLFGSMTIIIIISSTSELLEESPRKFTRFWNIVYRLFWVYFASLFCEGSPWKMRSRRSQMLLFLWLFAVLVLVNVLYSQFKGILTVKFDESYLRTVQDLANQPDILPLITPNSVTETVLKESSLKAYQDVYSSALKRQDEAFIELAQHMDVETYQLVKDGTHVLVTSRELAMFLMKDICPMLTGNRRLYFVDEDLTYAEATFHTNWDFPYYLRGKINERFLWMREGGFPSFWFSFYYRNFEKCNEFDQQEENSFLQLKHLHKAFFVYLFALLISMIALCLELLSALFFKVSQKAVHNWQTYRQSD